MNNAQRIAGEVLRILTQYPEAIVTIVNRDEADPGTWTFNEPSPGPLSPDQGRTNRRQGARMNRKVPDNIKALILQALRSGKYKQTQRVYEHEGCYCAMGAVLREAQVQGHLPMTPTLKELLDEEGASPTLEKLGVSPIRVGDTWLTLAIFAMNDEGETFQQIADYLEREFFPNC